MKHFPFSLLVVSILVSACVPASTGFPVSPSTNEITTFEPTIHATPGFELSWQPAFNLLVNLLSERAVLDKDGVFVDNLKYEDGNGMSSKSIPLDGPFGIAIQFSYQGSSYGAINLSDALTADPWWKDMLRVWVKSEGNAIHLDFYDGASDQRVGYFPLPELDQNSRFYIIFSDPQGKKLTVLDARGNAIQEVDVTKLGQGSLANGLFPESKMYAGFVMMPHSEMRINELSLFAPTTSNLFQLYETKELPAPPLRELARQRGITLGVEIDLANMEFYYDSRYQQIVAREFEAVTSGYGTGWSYAIHPNSSEFDWTKTDQVVRFVERAGLDLSWESLLFASEKTPDWLANGGFTQDQLLGILEDHIQTVVQRYKGVVTEWSVVSEADWSGPTGNSIFVGFPAPIPGTLLGQFLNGRIGPDIYIDNAFRWTRQADPNGVLIYTNAENETPNPRSDFEFNFLAQMIQNGMPIDAIGFEMNLQASDFKTDADIQQWKDGVIQNMHRFGNLGLQVIIKELTVNIGNVEGKTWDEKLDLQAKIYKAAVETCLESGGICTTLYLGGFTDTTSWLYYPGYPFGRAEAPNILDEYYKPKPAYFAIRDAFLGK